MSLNFRSRFILVIFIIFAIFTALAVLFFFQLKVNTALAQGDGEKIANFQEIIKNQDMSDIRVVEAGDIGPQSDGSGVEVVPIGAFRNIGDNADGWAHFFINGYIRNNSSDFACFMAPTYPPDGATLTGFSAVLKDDSTNSDAGLILFRVSNTNNDINGSQSLAGVVTSGFSSSTVFEILDPSITSGMATVSKDYNYYVYTCFDADTFTDILLYGARVFYSTP